MNLWLIVIDSLQKKTFERVFNLKQGTYFPDFKSYATLTPASMYAILLGKRWGRPGKDLFMLAREHRFSVSAYTMGNLFLIDNYNYSHWNRPCKQRLDGWADSLRLLPRHGNNCFSLLHFWKTHLPYELGLKGHYSNEYFGRYSVSAAKELLQTRTTQELKNAYFRQVEIAIKKVSSWLNEDDLFIITGDHSEGLENKYRHNLNEFFHGGSGKHLYEVPLWINREISYNIEGHIELHRFLVEELCKS